MALLLALSILLSLAACGGKAKTLTQEELEEIHRTEQELREKLVGVTWHYKDEPARAVRFDPDGTAEEYMGTIQWIEEYTFAVRYCEYYDMDAENLTSRERESVLKYYDYNVVIQYADEDLGGERFVKTLAFDGDALLLDNRRLVQGVDYVKTLPEGLSGNDALLNRVLYDAENNDYRLFFADGTGFRCNGVFLDGTLLNEEKFYWGMDGDLLYMMTPTQPGGEGPVLEEVEDFYLEADGNGYCATDYWNGTVRYYAPPGADDDSANRLSHNYDMLREAVSDWGY